MLTDDLEQAKRDILKTRKHAQKAELEDLVREMEKFRKEINERTHDTAKNHDVKHHLETLQK